MTIEYSWVIDKLEYYPSKNGFDKLVYNIYYAIRGVSGDYVAMQHDVTPVVIDNIKPEDFIPFEDLTKDIVVGWLEGALSADYIQQLKDTIANNINIMMNPPSVMANPPWDN